MKLYASVDFYDEMLPQVWTPELLAQYFHLMKSKGISRIYWIDQKEIMQRHTQAIPDENFRRTWENFDGRLHAGAVAAAHQADLEIFSLIKPFEMGIFHKQLTDSGKSDGFDAVGSRLVLCQDFAVKHPEAMLARQVFAANEAVKFVLNFSQKLEKDAVLKIFGSNRNKNYTLLEEKNLSAGTSLVEIERKQFDFYLFVLEGAKAGNTLRKIVYAEDIDGNRLPVTLGLCPREYGKNVSNHTELWQHTSRQASVFEYGMGFDYLPGVPSTIFTPESVENRFFDFASAPQHVLGVTSLLNSRCPVFPDPENAVFQDFAEQWVREAIAEGFDGIEMRISSHSSPIFWSEYGSGREIRIRRGEAYFDMLRKFSAITRQAGKIFGVHIPDFIYDNTPDKSCALETYFDYRAWINERIMDEVTAKIILGDNGFLPGFAELCKLCREANIPYNVCPFLHRLDDPLSYAKQTLLQDADAFNIFETATLWGCYQNGVFPELDPDKAKLLWQILCC